MAMEVIEKNRVLKEVHGRFESGRWDDLDVRLLMRVAAVAVNSRESPAKLAVSIDAEFDRVAELRALREDSDAHMARVHAREVCPSSCNHCRRIGARR